MSKKQRFDLIVVGIILLLTWGFSYTPLFERLNNLSIDITLVVRDKLFGPRHPPASSQVVVIALDEFTYRTAPFSSLPKVLWTPEIAKVQDVVLGAGASVIGYDVIFPTSVQAYIPDYEKPFLRSLMRAAKQGKLVLGKVQHNDHPVAPHRAQSFVVGNQQNIRALNLQTDSDGVIRRIPLFFDTQAGGKQTSMALELAARASGVAPAVDPQGGVTLGDYRIPGSADNAMLLNFQAGADIPTYSLADLYACMQAGNTAYFEDQFKDKVVLLGAVLDVEDRKLTSKRLMTGLGGPNAAAQPCALPEAAKVDRFERDTIPGVYITAAAVNDLLRQELLSAYSHTASLFTLFLIAAIASLIGFLQRPLRGVISIVVVALGLLGLSAAAAQAAVASPMLAALAVLLVSYSLMTLYRYMTVDKQKARIRRLFGLYLQPRLVDQMLEEEGPPELGGELREVTVWFSDLANFTEISEQLSPTELVSLMNHYFGVVTELIEAHGGFVDKYIGDAVVAIFGAPQQSTDHANQAVNAALTVQNILKEMNQQGVFGKKPVGTRIGINTGQALIGNVGSSKRFNYTAMGDTVNLASRLEGVNKKTATSILISDTTASKLSADIVAREIATVRVKGKHEAVTVYEPLAKAEGFSEQQIAEARVLESAFRDAQQHFRAQRFDQMIEVLTRFDSDPAAQVLRDLAKHFLSHPPDSDWDGIQGLTEK